MDTRFKEYSCNDCTARDKIVRGCQRPDYTGPAALGKIVHRFDDFTLTYCPYSHIDWAMLGDAIDCEFYLSSGFLPDEGTVLDQTEFCIESTKLVQRAKNNAEAKHYEAMKSK